jgi:2-oxoisovalerate dehydrogenase E2 component (dihydrolipoyl transacylase)
MERVFVMPDLGEGLEEGQIVEWLVGEGDEVTLNQPLVEVDTAKAAVEIPSPFAGRVARLHGSEGEDVPVGEPLVTFEVEVAQGSGPGDASLAASPLGPDVPGSPTPSPVPSVVSAGVKATPPVRKLAKAHGVDIGGIDGTGPDGRVTEADVQRLVAGMRPGGGAGVVAVAVSEDLGSRLMPVDAVRREIGGVLTRQAAIPQVTTFRTVDCSTLEDFRRDVGTSPLPVVVAALCRVVDRHPLLNAGWLEDVIELREKINVGVAVDTERGLLVPVVQDAGHQGIADIAGEIARVADAARAGTLALEDKLARATIAVSNTGSYGSEAGTPILSPGTSVTLAFGVIEPRALVVGRAVVARPAATISLTFDHRVLDGAAAGRALTDLVSLLESADHLGGLPR